MRSVEVALRKRPVEPDRIERMVNGIVRQLESSGETEIHSEQIGILVILPETFDIMLQRVQTGGSKNAGLPQSAAKTFPPMAGGVDKAAPPAQKASDRCAKPL